MFNLAETYILYFDKALFTIFPFTKNFDFSERMFFCAFLLIAFQCLAVVFETLASKRS